MKIKYYLRYIKWIFTGSYDWTNPPNRRWKDDNWNWIGPKMTIDENDRWFGK